MRKLLLPLALIGSFFSGVPADATGLHFQRVVVPGSDKGTEPSIALSQNGTRYVSWQSPGKFARSDDGHSFTSLATPDPSALGDVTNATDATGALYNAQICGGPYSLHSCVYRSVDGGKTWPLQTHAADSHPGASDRPWIDVYPRNGTLSSPDKAVVYLQYHTFSPDDLVYVTVSMDGGHTFSAPHFVTTDTTAVSGSGCNTIPSGVAVDQRNGWVYALWLSGHDVVSNLATGCNYSQIGPFGKAWVSVSKDKGSTWASHLAWQGAFDMASKTGDNADKIFGTIGVDRGGQVQIALPVRHHDDPLKFVQACESGAACKETNQSTDLLLASSPDGEHWTSPVTLATKSSNFFPWIAAGATGVVDIASYHSSSLRPNDPTSVWYIAFTQVSSARSVLTKGRALYVGKPRVQTTLLSSKPIHRGGICSFGIFCSVVPKADRSLADSIAIQLDPAGGANIVWTVEENGKTHIEFACQDRGSSAIGRSMSGCYQAIVLRVR